MLSQARDTTAESAVALLIHYSFDLSGYTAGELTSRWLNDYPANWVRLAVIEALYRGRYKAISVEQILAVWNQRGRVFYRFNHEFERLVCGDIPQTLSVQTDSAEDLSLPVSQEIVRFSDRHDALAIVTAEKSAGEKPKEAAQHYYQISDNNQKPQLRRTQATRSPSSASQPPIEQFSPKKTDASDFYTKLKAIIRQPEDKQQID